MKIDNWQLKITEQKGFTLIELMVVIAIVGILAATAIVNSGKNPDRDVRLEQDRLITFLRNVQGKALSSEKVSGASGKVCGFGVRTSGLGLQTYYVATGVDEDCSSHTGDTGSNLSSDIFTPNISGVSVLFSGSLFFLSPNGDISCSGCAGWPPATFSVSKTGATAVQVQVEQSGNIH